ncbi:MAG: biotin/lipoyl-binding protein, partial [Gammaproteobacteria bacterium]|nr:biotin/lipoyl-binding protein [Gammaproteobacteria bacterium]
MHTHNNTDIARTLGMTGAPGRRWLRWRWAGLVILVLVFASLLLMRGSGTAGAPEYRTEVVQRADLTAMVTATGNLQPTNQVDVGIEVSGTIASVEVDFNDQVQIGQVLARLDTSKLDAQLRKSGASLAAAQARVEQMRATMTESHKNLQRLQRIREISN